MTHEHEWKEIRRKWSGSPALFLFTYKCETCGAIKEVEQDRG